MKEFTLVGEKICRDNYSKFRKIDTDLHFEEEKEGIKLLARVYGDVIDYASIVIPSKDFDSTKKYVDGLYNKCINVKNEYHGDFKLAVAVAFQVLGVLSSMESILQYSMRSSFNQLPGFNKDVLKMDTYCYDAFDNNNHIGISISNGLINIDIDSSVIIKKGADYKRTLYRSVNAIGRIIRDTIDSLDLSDRSNFDQSYLNALRYLTIFNMAGIYGGNVTEKGPLAIRTEADSFDVSRADDLFIINGMNVTISEDDLNKSETILVKSPYDNDYELAINEVCHKLLDEYAKSIQLEKEAKERQAKAKFEADKKEQQRLLERQRVAMKQAEKFNFAWFNTHKIVFGLDNINDYRPEEISVDVSNSINLNDNSTDVLNRFGAYYRLKAIQEEIYGLEYVIMKVMPNTIVRKIFTDKNDFPYHKAVYINNMEVIYKLIEDAGDMCLKYTCLLGGKEIGSGFINDEESMNRCLNNVARLFGENNTFKNPESTSALIDLVAKVFSKKAV